MELRAAVKALAAQPARVFEGLKLDYCCGEGKSLAQACRERHVDSQDVLAQLEAAVEAGKDQSDENWNSAALAELCDHIEQSHHAYLHVELPRLSDLISKVVAAMRTDIPN